MSDVSDLLTIACFLLIVSESLRSLTKNKQIAHLLIFGQKTSNLLRKLVSEFPALF